MDAIKKHHEITHRLQDMQKRHKTGKEHNEQDLQETIKRTKSRPSPGSVYPMLKKVVADDLIIKMDGGKYDLTDKSRETVYYVFGNTCHRDRHQQSNILEGALIKLENSVLYLEDAQKRELIQYEELIMDLSRRLRKIVYSILEE